MPLPRWRRVIVCIVALFFFDDAQADEPSKDVAIAQMDGLALWLDAGQEGESRKASGVAKSNSGDPLPSWHDASPAKRHAVQGDPKLQPKLFHVGMADDDDDDVLHQDANWVVRFDGEDDHLRTLIPAEKLTDFTLFVVAAPHSNGGGYRGLLAFNRSGARDYETGFAMDQNAAATAALQNINCEGRGFGGARNLMNAAAPFGTLHVFECVADSKLKQVRFAFDGRDSGKRAFVPAELTADEITVGARFPTNGPDAVPRGFLHGDIAEVLLFNRVLSDAELKSMRSYLDAKHASLMASLPHEVKLLGSSANVEPLIIVADPPPIQMLVPGFSVYELPVGLPNINNLRSRADGMLYALGYNGDIWLLSDTNADGLEDKAEPFFDSQGRLRGPIGMAVIPQGHVLLGGLALKAGVNDQKVNSPQGVVVASKGKISAILDMDGDGLAEEEKVIAGGWKEIPPNVDAIGVAIDAAGAIYFGLGTAAYNNAYLVDSQGKAHFDLQSERGTIMKIEPDLSARSIVCTGVRFTIGLEFDEHGELFASDQEGATWLPNGNPFDELLHIPMTESEAKPHYGFPPRHPKHLPDVIDEPSLFDYAPQHQSTCGMSFNLPRTYSLKGAESISPHTTLFGPESWRGDIFVTGESRGKLYRTELARTEAGHYVARNHLLARLSMLTVDCCLSPRGDLLVACHSGGPDWGTGPTGKGKLFAIRYTDWQAPQPVATWAAGPQEVRVAFDQPLDPAHLKNLAGQTKITYGEFVSAADRFETLRPGYAVVQAQLSSPRYNLPVHGISVTPDRRTLVISTAPHRADVQYALVLPRLTGSSDQALVTKPSGEEKEGLQSGNSGRPLPQHPQVDLAYSLNGVLATWVPDDNSRPSWTGVLPHLDLDVSRLFSGGDLDARLGEILAQPGTLTLQTQFDLRDLLHPAVQPGSKLDHEWPEEQIRIRFSEPRMQSIAWTVGDKKEERSFPTDDSAQLVAEFSSTSELLPRVTLTIRTGGRTESDERRLESKSLGRVRWLDAAKTRERELSLNRFRLPFVETKLKNDSSPQKRDIPELAGGSWGRGRRVFFSDAAACAKCHVIHGSGGAIGPDLSNLIHRDYTSVLRDVTQPSFSINPDYIASIVSLDDGRVLTGSIRTENAKLLIGDKEGRVHMVSQDEIEELRHSPLSIMPEGIPQLLGPARMRDLLTFLLTEPPRMPIADELTPVKPRSRAEVAKVLAQSPESPVNAPPVRILLVAGAKDHGPGEHDYPAWLGVWSELLRGADGVTVETAMEWPTAEQFATADTIAFFQKGSWSAERAKAIDDHIAKGRGLVYIHWAIEGGAEASAFAQRIGLASNAATTKYRHGPLDLSFQTPGIGDGNVHPIARNFSAAKFHDESYWQLQGDPSKLRRIATGVEVGQPHPLFWTIEPPAPNAEQPGRIFVSVLGHYSTTFDDPLFRILLLRGFAWSLKEPVDRFSELATIGVELGE